MYDRQYLRALKRIEYSYSSWYLHMATLRSADTSRAINFGGWRLRLFCQDVGCRWSNMREVIQQLIEPGTYSLALEYAVATVDRGFVQCSWELLFDSIQPWWQYCITALNSSRHYAHSKTIGLPRCYSRKLNGYQLIKNKHSIFLYNGIVIDFLRTNG